MDLDYLYRYLLYHRQGQFVVKNAYHFISSNFELLYVQLAYNLTSATIGLGSRSESWHQTLLTLFVHFMMIVPTTAIIYYCILGSIIASNYQTISSQIDDYQPPTEFLKLNDLQFFINQWKHQHAAVYECTERFNRSFGPILLLYVTSIFVGVINQAFFILVILSEKMQLNYTLVLIVFDYLANLAVICYVADQIRFQVTFLIKRTIISTETHFCVGFHHQPIAVETATET